MFYSNALFPFTGILSKNWHAIRGELDALDRAEFMDWPEHSLYGEKGWQTFGLYAFGTRQPEGCARCPQTEALVKQIPGLMMAGFSRLAPGARIVPHRGYEGYAGYVLRVHLGLDVPNDCGLRVGEETRTWTEGECTVFDDSFEHEAWNNSGRTRTVLLCDFLNPLRRRPLILNPKFTPELIGYIEREHLPNCGLGQRALWYLWKITNPGLMRQVRANKAHDHDVA
jgi:aspartyl/asparaginyl beta-hydroxylase (cupin superfamily)